MMTPVTEIPVYYQRYVDNVKHLSVIEALQQSALATQLVAETISEEAADFRYAPEKWSIREVLCHMIDTERIFAYRALRFGRGDKTPLSSFDENAYTPNSNAEARSMKRIREEMNALRKTTIHLFEDFTPEMLMEVGESSGVKFSTELIGYLIAGHDIHHVNILKERYLR